MSSAPIALSVAIRGRIVHATMERTMTKPDDPAFIEHRETRPGKRDGDHCPIETVRWSGGLTKREWFAGQIIGHIIPLTAWRTETMHSLSDVADASVKFADALIAALNKVSDG